MSDCDHPKLSIGSHSGFRHTGDNGLPRQAQFGAMCDECGDVVIVDYNIAFVDGDKV